MNKNGTTPLDALDRNMDRILSESLPDALNQLAQRHESFGQVVQYLEDNYIASQRSGNDKILLENEAKKYVTKGLVNVLKDIEVASLNIDQLLQMQTMSIDSMSDDVTLITSRLNGMKSQHLLTSLEEMKVSYINTSNTTSNNNKNTTGTGTVRPDEDNLESSIRRIPVDYVQDTDIYDAEESVGDTPITGAGRKDGSVGGGGSSSSSSSRGGGGVSGGEQGSGRDRLELPGLEPRRRITMEDRLASLSAMGTNSSN